MFKKLLPLLFLFAGFQVNAAVVFTYELNTSDWDYSSITDGDTLTFSFLDGTDLYNISSADIVSYKYDFAAGHTGTNYFADNNWLADAGDIGSAFSWDGFTLDLTFDTLGGDLIRGEDDAGYYSMVQSGQANQIFSQHSNMGAGGVPAYAQLAAGMVLTLSSTFAVPEPSIIALFGLGLVGLGFARRKRQL